VIDFFPKNGRIINMNTMDKKSIKQRIGKAIENNPMKKDIKKVSLFGSYIHEKQSGNSDVDILIEFKPTAKVGYFKLADMQRSITGSVGKKVDLSTPEALSKFFKDSVLKEAELIYEG